MDRTAAYRLVKYRGRYAVAWRKGGRVRRASLRTDDPEIAARRFADWLTDVNRPADTVAAIYRAHLEDRTAQGRDTSRKGYAWRNLAPVFAALRPDQVSRARCRLYANGRRAEGASGGTILRELAELRSAIRWHNPASPAVFELPSPSPPRDRHLTRDEFRRLLAACAAPHLELFCTLAVTTAARSGALLGLTWDRVDFSRRIIRLDDGEGGGRRKGRAAVPMNDTAFTILSTARAAALTDHVIEYAGGPIKSVRRAFARTAARARLAGVTPHVLRHTAAVWMAEAARPMPEIAWFLGHEDSRVTEKIYAVYTPDYLRESAKALEI